MVKKKMLEQQKNSLYNMWVTMPHKMDEVNIMQV